MTDTLEERLAKMEQALEYQEMQIGALLSRINELERQVPKIVQKEIAGYDRHLVNLTTKARGTVATIMNQLNELKQSKKFKDTVNV